MTEQRIHPDASHSIAHSTDFRNVGGSRRHPAHDEPVRGLSEDGELEYCTSIEGGAEAQITSLAGRLESPQAIRACLDTVRTVFAATPTTGRTVIFLRNLTSATDEGLAALVDALRHRCFKERGAVEPRVELSPVMARLLQLFRLPSRHGIIRWDNIDECLVVSLRASRS